MWKRIDILVLKLQLMIAARGLRFRKRERRASFEESVFRNIRTLKLGGKQEDRLMAEAILLLGAGPKEREIFFERIFDTLDILEKQHERRNRSRR